MEGWVKIFIKEKQRALIRRKFIDITWTFFHTSLTFSRITTQYNEVGSSGSIVSDYGLDDRAIDVLSPAEAKGFFL
jgi:hypothetical protein